MIVNKENLCRAIAIPATVTLYPLPCLTGLRYVIAAALRAKNSLITGHKVNNTEAEQSTHCADNIVSDRTVHYKIKSQREDPIIKVDLNWRCYTRKSVKIGAS